MRLVVPGCSGALEAMERLGRIPRWPDDRQHILDLEDLISVWIERMDAKGKIRLEGEDRVNASPCSLIAGVGRRCVWGRRTRTARTGAKLQQ